MSSDESSHYDESRRSLFRSKPAAIPARWVANAPVPLVSAFEQADEVLLVASLNRPGGNLTGVTFLLSVIAAKQFEVLQEAVPKPGTIGFLVNPTLPEAEAAVTEVRAADKIGCVS